MRYLRMLSNSVAAGCLATAYVLVVVLQLNPAIPFQPAVLGSLVTTAGLFYVVHCTVICYVLLVVRQLLAREFFSPGWLSVGVLVWLGAAAAAAGAALMWANVSTFARVLDDSTVAAMTGGALALGGAAISFLLVAWLRRAYGRRGRGVWAFLVCAVAAASLVVPLALRGTGAVSLLDARPLDVTMDSSGPPEPGARVTVIALDAASLEFIARATAEGRLPNFGRLLDAGAVVHLATIHPTSAEAVWAAAATGKLPLGNGVRSASIYHLAGGRDVLELLPDYCFANQLVRLGFLVEEPHTAATLRTRTLWSILSTHGLSVGAVGWPLTEPAPAVRGYVVGDTYLRLAGTPSGVVDSPAVYPAGIQREVTASMEHALASISAFSKDAGSVLDRRQQEAGRTDRVFDRIARDLVASRPPQVVLTRYQGLDPIGHYFLRYASPLEFGDLPDAGRRGLGAVLEDHYRFIDEAIGRAIEALGPDDLLLVASGYGMEPMGMGKRLGERVLGDPYLSGTHDAAPDGFLLAYGAPVAPGHPLARASVVDITPTILYFLGLPIGRDMDGYARADLFRRTFTDRRPISFIPTYDR
ncbi:MAG: alkaline phosphatase family protein [Acidobacteriota bacterium]